jgi:hypothetical protein
MDKTGGPAFPIPGLHGDADFNGMTLRDYFAAKAMQGMVASPQFCEGGWPDVDIAQQAYDIADAMLAARGAA